MISRSAMTHSPQQVVTGARHRVPLQQLIQGKCVDPETGQGPR